MKKILRAAAGILFLAGIILTSIPYALRINFHKQAEDVLNELEEVKEKDRYEELRQAMLEYNEKLFLDGQSTLIDQHSYEEPDFNPSDYGVESEILCSISIPSIDVELPVYNGASGENMRKGAAYLAKTSLPVGGNSTNCVIAAHNIYHGIKMFYDICTLQAGDSVLVTNYWETLEYEVVSIEIVDPDDNKSLYIVPDQELLTLTTCSSSGQNSKRYIVRAERKRDFE